MKNFIKLIALFAILLSLGLIANSVLSVRTTFAQVPFGGPGTIISVCNTGFLVIVGPPIPGTYLIRQIPKGPWMAGLFVPVPAPCFFLGNLQGMGFPVIWFGSG